MLFNTNLMNSTDTELLAVLLGNRRTAETMLRNAKGSLFALLHQTPQDNADLFCSEVKRSYSGDPVSKLQAARELVARAIAEELQHRDALNSPAAVRALLQHRLAGLPHEVFAVHPAGCTEPGYCNGGAFPGNLDADERLSARGGESCIEGERCRRDLCAQPPVRSRRTEPRRRVTNPVPQASAFAC